MNGSTGAKERYIAEYGLSRERLPGSAAPWMAALRESAAAAFQRQGFPTPRQEDWKYTSVAPIEKQAFGIAAGAPAGGVGAPAVPGYAAVLVNGVFSPDRSQLGGLPAGVEVAALAQVLEREPQAVEPYLGHLADVDANGFVALNTALCADGALVRVAPGTRLERPLFLVHDSRAAEPMMSCPRHVIVAGEGSEFTVVEVYRGDGVYLTNAVTEIHIAAGAAVEHCKLQVESQSGFHVATVQARQAADSRFVSRNFSAGARLARNDVNAALGAGGGECTLDGLYLAAGRQHVDNHTFIDHAVPGCVSREAYKGVLDGRARAVFNGRILVRQDAQKTDARQTNHNLLMSQDAEIDTKPQLEIYADDVRCAHGATVGFLDADALFYLRSRGLDEADARGLLVYAFARELLDRVPDAGLRRWLEHELMRHVPGVTAALQALPEAGL